MAATRLYLGSQAQAVFGFGPSLPGQITDGASINWFVPVTDQNSAINYHSVDPAFPQIGSQHPEISTLYCSRLSTGDVTPSGWYVRADYSLPAALAAPQPEPDRTAPGFVAWETATSKRQLSLPFFLKVSVSAPNTLGPVVPVTTYEARERSIVVQSTELTVTVNTASWSLAAALGVSRSVGEVQAFPDGTLALFVGASSRRTGVMSYTVTYRWMIEPNPIYTAPELASIMPDATNIQWLPVIPAAGLVAFERFSVRYQTGTQSPYVITTTDYPTLYAPTTTYTTYPGAPIT